MQPETEPETTEPEPNRCLKGYQTGTRNRAGTEPEAQKETRTFWLCVTDRQTDITQTL